MGKRYFISHRHDDKEIAQAVKTNLETWNIVSEEIFLSSDARMGLTVGDEVLSGIREAAKDTKLLILVYTSQADDWSWCMWECGLVEDPATVKTRVVVFQCSVDVPEVFRGTSASQHGS